MLTASRVLEREELVALIDTRVDLPGTRTLQAASIEGGVSVAAEVVRHYSGGFEGLAKFSVRKRQDGCFQAYHDNQLLESDQDYQGDGEPISGLFDNLEAAEAELFRHPSFKSISNSN